ncbi:SusC/RagA family TonB-linked outer membrane protein [Flagellimonas olearia]|uniref:SusC/RagA family TonB-linked outer membrane protein n=2 Tax=Flagellimonas olearia TaxID=552546 RepID=A0A6I1E371_9FLAO|nr:SusC/RagA family TonB-linked outer membrane protein [Allomuricauda olearia]
MVANDTYSQRTKITLNLENVSVARLLDEIEGKTDFRLVYITEDVDLQRRISVKGEKVRVVSVLDEVFKATNTAYKIIDRQIFLYDSKLAVVDPKGEGKDNTLKNPQFSVSGTVLDQSGVPLSGANILEKGTTNGVIADFDGNFTIDLADGNALLVVSYLGFSTKEIAVNGKSEFMIVLEENAAGLDEVVVTALGITRSKKSLSYATEGVDPNEITEARPINMVNGLTGKVAGLRVTTTGSGVGAPSKVTLRGNRSINGSSQPIYVVDGIILNGDISNLSPDNIASISVMQGANAAALYGSRANNGAIIIETKSGIGAEEGISSSLGFTFMGNAPIILTKYQNEYGQGANGIYSENAVTSWGPRFDGSLVNHWSNDPNYIENQLGGNSTYAYTAQPDNIKDFFQTGTSLAANLSVNINSEKSNAFFSYTHTDASGIIAGNDLNKNDMAVRWSSDLTDRLTLDSKLNYIREDYSNVLFTGESFNNPVRYLYQIPRNIRTQDLEHYQFVNSAGQTRQHFYSPGFNGAGNPYWTRNNVVSPRISERVLAMMSLNYDILDNLSVQVRSALDRTNSKSETKMNNDTYVTADNGSYSRLYSDSFEWNTDLLLSYNTTFLNDDFQVNLNLGANNRRFKADGLGASGVNFQIENLFAISNTTDPIPTDNYYLEKEVNSVYAYGDISYKNAIFLSVTGRNDWSSTLPSDSWSYYYPSVGLSAVVSELVDLPEAISYLKLRGSYAEVGNDTNPYMLSRNASINNGTISLSTTLPNDSLKPESTNSFEVGMDLRLIDRLRFNMTYYKTNTYDQLFASPVPIGSGVTSVFQNGADVENEGFEFALGSYIVDNPDFSWDVDLNLSTNRNTVLNIADGFDELTQASDYIRTYKLVAGQPFGDIYSRGFVRDDQGRIVVDANGLPEITVGQDVKVANYNPDWTAGLNNTFRYKNFSLSALVDMRKGGSFISFTESILAGAGVLDYTAQGRDGSLVFGENIFDGETAITEDGSPNTTSISAENLWNHLGGLGAPVGEAFVRDATNVRLRELVLGYSLPERLISKTPFKSARISLVGRNLFFFYNASDVDPEMVTDISNGAEGRESLSLPTTRSFGASINIGF